MGGCGPLGSLGSVAGCRFWSDGWVAGPDVVRYILRLDAGGGRDWMSDHDEVEKMEWLMPGGQYVGFSTRRQVDRPKRPRKGLNKQILGLNWNSVTSIHKKVTISQRQRV